MVACSRRPVRLPPITVALSCLLCLLCLVCLVVHPSASGAGFTNRSLHDTGWGDLDGDGRPDEVVLRHLGNTSHIEILLTGLGQASSLLTDEADSSVIAVDIDGDGALDLITASPNGSQVWLNDGHGVFKPARIPLRRALSRAGTVDAIAHETSMAVSGSVPLLVDPLITQPGGAVASLRAPSRPVWFSSPERCARLLRAPPSHSKLV